MAGFIFLGVLAGFVLFMVFVSNSRWFARRGWVYNKHNPRPPGSTSLKLLDEIYTPAIEHVIEEESSEAIRADDDESGGKPNLD